MAESPPQPKLARSPKFGRLPNFTGLRAKLIIPYVLLTIALAMVGMYIVTQLVTSSIQERFTNQLLEASRVTADGVVRHEREHLEILRLLVFTEGVAQAVKNEDAETLQARLLPLALNSRLEALTIVNLQGQELLTLALDPNTQQYTASQGGDFSQFPAVSDVLIGRTDVVGDKFVGLLETTYGDYLFTTAPVQDTDGQLVGVLMVGTRLKMLLEELKAQSLADVTVLDLSGKLLASTLAESEMGETAQALEIEPTQIPDLNLSTTRNLSLYGRSYQAVYAPLVIRQQTMGVLAVALPSNYIVERGATSRNQISLLFALGTLAVIIIGNALAQRIAHPILRLRAASQAIASGDLEQTTGVHQPDEIGELANAFDRMTVSLRERTEALRERNRQLEEAYAKLQSAQQQLLQSEKLAAVGQLTAGIVHDVKNPLAIIIGLAEELPEHGNLDPALRKHLAAMRDSARRANTIVTDLLKFARESTPEMKRQDLRETIETVLRLSDYMARKAKVQVIKQLPDTPILVMYDALQIEQVLLNLIQNAIQAMPYGGTLRVNLSEAEEAVAIAVQDTGVGIPPKNLTRIFDPFFTTKPPGEGTGLGLSVSYGIVARHGGRIDVGSVVGQGTTFTILLSAKPQSSMPEQETAE